MNIQAEISWIQSELSKVTDPELISTLKCLLLNRSKKEDIDWWNEITPEEKAEIQAGIRDIEIGNIISHEEVMANPRKWI